MLLAVALVGRVGLHGGELAHDRDVTNTGGVVGRRDNQIRMDSKAESDLARPSSPDHLLPADEARQGNERSLLLIQEMLARLLYTLRGW